MCCDRSLLKHFLNIAKRKYHTMFHFFYGNKGICIIWPSTIPRGGIKKGVLLGFWYDYKLNDKDCFLSHGTNKQIFYKIYETLEEIDEKPIKKLLKEAIKLDSGFKNRPKPHYGTP